MPTDLQNDPAVSPMVPLPAGVAYTLNMTDALLVNTRADMLTLHHAAGGVLTTGIPGFGTGIRFEGPKVDGTFVDIATIEGGWIDPDTANPYGTVKIYCRRYGVPNFNCAQFQPDYAWFPAGSVANPGIAFIGATNFGFCASGGALRATVGAVNAFSVNGTGVSFCGVTTPVAAQSVLASLTNNCTASGTTGTIANWTDMTTYSTSAQLIHDAVSQIAKKLTAMEIGIKAFGLLVT